MYPVRFIAGALAATLLLQTVHAQDRGPLTNQRICELLADGVSTQEVIRVIMSAPQIDFTLQPAYIDLMLKAGVTDDVIRAMAARENGHVVAVPPQVTTGRATAIVDKTLKMRTEADPNLQMGKPRVFVQGSNDAWSINYGKNSGTGGSHPQTVELMKTFGQSCSNITVTNNPEAAEYTVTFQRESSKVWRRDNKMVVFNRAGDMIYSASTRELGNAVRGFCRGL
jgi:hypothetical protein